MRTGTSMYKLNEPVKKPFGERLPFYAFAAIISAFLLWIVLIRPMSLPADQMPFIFEYNKDTHEVYANKQKRTYFMLTSGAILTAALLTIPTVRNSNKRDYAMAKLWANREYLDTDEFSELVDMVNTNIFFNNGADNMLHELQSRVDKHDGKHITGRKYFKKECVKDLQKIGGAHDRL